MMCPGRTLTYALVLVSVFAAAARAQIIHVGVVVSLTGPAAALGIPQKASVALFPREIGGSVVQYTVLDDGSDPARAVADMRKLIEETHADAIIGSSTAPASLAMLDVAAEKQVPMISLAASAAIVRPMTEKRAWVFKTPQDDSMMADAIAGYMSVHGVHTVGFIGFNDAYGDGWLKEATRAWTANEITLVATQRFNRGDTSVTAQAQKLAASRPDAILIAAAGSPAVLPQIALKERGYDGPIYQTHGVATQDFIRSGGRAVEGTILSAGPVLVADQLPNDNPVKAVALRYIHAYEAANGPGSVATFGAYAFDAAILLQQAVPLALPKAAPGTADFRAALRSALEGLHEVVLTHGIADMSPQNHNGLDERARVLVTVQNGTWVLLGP
jgi:branched-chain amino acid transport system substrate-binding protein